MKFGKVERPDLVDFSFPPISEKSIEFLRNQANDPSKESEIFVGATGWSMPEWKRSIYPKGTKAKNYLPLYSKHFNTIEFNTTHYRIPDFSQIEKWVKGSVADFKFCPKLPQSVSHRKDLGLESGQLDLFIESISGFGSKLGSCFIQLPPYFGPDRKSLLLQFIHAWSDSNFELCIEFRHEDWFKGGGLGIFDELRNLNIGAVITDVSGRRDVLHQEITAAYTMIRFVGNGMINSDLDRMSEWVNSLKKLCDNGLSHCYYFTHQPDNILGPEAAEFIGKLLKKEGLKVRFPSLTALDSGQQASLF